MGEMQHSPGPRAEALGSSFLPILWQAPGRVEESRMATEAWLEAALAFSAPVSMAFVLCIGRGEARGGLVVGALDGESAAESAGLIRSTVSALNVWQGLGAARPFEAPATGPNVFDIAPCEGPGRQILTSVSAPWKVAMQQPEPTVMTVQLLSSDTTAERPAVRCAVSVSGHGPAAEMIATLLAADPPGDVRLESRPRQGPNGRPLELSLPLSMAAHIVSSPARIPGAWPETPMRPPGQLLDLIEQATPPHAALFGGSGQGKTTLLEHLVDASFASQRTVVVICPHGDLAARAASVAERRGTAFRAADFGDLEHGPRWNLCTPPRDVSPTEWVTELIRVIRAAWRDMPEEYFGPMFEKSIRVALSVLIRDPHAEHPLTELPGVLSPPLDGKWATALVRIGDESLSRDLREVHSAIQSDSEKRYSLWLTSKLERLTVDDRMRRVFGHRASTLELSRVAAGESLIVSAPASALGDAGASIVVGAVLTQLWHLIRRRPQPAPTIDIFVDEAHRIPPEPLGELLAEGRKFRARLRLATQSPLQFDPSTCDTVVNNSGAVGTFRTGPREAAYLHPLFPATAAGALNRLGRHRCAMTDGEQEIIAVPPRPITEPGDRAALEAASREQHEDAAPTVVPGSPCAGDNVVELEFRRYPD